MKQLKNKVLVSLILILTILVAVLWIQKNTAQKKHFQTQQELKKSVIKSDSLVKLSDGYYAKLVADTLTRKQLKKLAADIVDLKNREPVSITTTIIQPVEVLKDTDSISVVKDSVFIKDFYPNKESPFLTYSNRFSLKTQKGLSNFVFDSITLRQVITKKENGLYRIDFKGPDFLEVKSLDIQTEPKIQLVKDNWGTLIGVEYGKSLEIDKSIFEVNVYQRYKKFYIGGAISSNNYLKGGIKFEF